MVSITIDCEEWNSPVLRGIKDKNHNNTSFSRIGNERLLKLFSKYEAKATFFITGYYASLEKENVKQILEEGHEVALHGYEHHYRNRKFDVEKDIVKGKKVLEKITGEKVKGFRAPQVQYSLRLLEVLKKHGFQYDSSLHPAFLPGYYNNSNYPLRIHNVNGLKEIPLAVMPKLRLPISWMFMRNLGVNYTQMGVNALVRKKINPVLYFHSWEFVRMPKSGLPSYLTRNTGLKFLKMLEKIVKKNGSTRMDAL